VALYTNESRDRVRDAVDFVELVSARTELRRAGPARFEGLCPFHDERTPSFGIDPTQKVYHCFGCQASGDVFTFVQETEGVDFKAALELLADRYGVELEREQEDPREAELRRRRERLLELLARTSAYYERYLWESAEAARARDYLAGRGLSEQILKEFRVGYAPSAWDRVLTASLRGGFSEQELRATGLAQRSKQSGQPYDRFRARIMFPLADIRGRVLGFGARALGADPAPVSDAGAEGRRPPKYLNTSENDLYKKGLHLYGAHLARVHAARAGQVVLCEGYTDTIALHQAGMRNAVGLMGTALTPEQVSELARMANTVLLALDADSAGQEAMLRASGLAAKRKLELRVLPLPAGTDPADLLQRDGPQAMETLLSESVPFVRFRVERVLAAGDHSSPEGRDAMIDELRPVFAMLPPSAMRMELTRVVSDRLALPGSLAERLLAADAQRSNRQDLAAASHARPGDDRSDGTRAGPSASAPRPQARREMSRREDPERAFLALCLASPQEGAEALASLEIDEHFASELLGRAARHLREGDLSDPLTDSPGQAHPVERDPELSALLAELVVESGRWRISDGAAQPGMLEVQRLQLELARVEREIQRARAHESGDVNELALRRAEVMRQFDRAYGRVLEETGDRAG
jgi:DNA primase